jgi:hypothetical protein
MQRVSEDELCKAFADHIKDSLEFVSWVLGYTKFAALGSEVRVLWKEQKEKRTSPNAPWWRHWHNPSCLCQGCRGGMETDIFIVFELIDNKKRFSLHIENKTLKRSFDKGQAEAYPVRARCWANKERFLNYTEFQTMLIAPNAFRQKKNNEELVLFDSFIAHEEIAKIVSRFDSSKNQRGA